MADKNIKITVRDRRAIVEGSPVIICGNSGYTVTFAFDDEWNLTGARTARFVYFKDGKVQHEDKVFSGNVVAVPVLSDVAFVKVGVFAGDLQTTTPARINCELSILCGSGAVHEPTPDVYDQIMARFNEMAEAGAFGATEAQAQQIAANQADIAALLEGNKKAAKATNAEQLGGQSPSYYATAQSAADNKADIQALIAGSKKAGDADKLDGHDSGYFATAQSATDNKTSIDNLKSGATPAGNANKLGGKDASEYALNADIGRFDCARGLSTSILEKALEVGVGVHRFQLAGDAYAGADLPSNLYYYSVATIYKRASTSIVIELLCEFFNAPILNAFNGIQWTGWGTGATTADLANYMPKSGGDFTGNVTIGNGSSYLQLDTWGSLSSVLPSSGGQWMRGHSFAAKTDGGTLATMDDGFGAYGVGNYISWLYMGGPYYNPVLSVLPDGRTVKINGNVAHHDGNSVKMAFTESDATAPSDTTALWAHL